MYFHLQTNFGFNFMQVTCYERPSTISPHVMPRLTSRKWNNAVDNQENLGKQGTIFSCCQTPVTDLLTTENRRLYLHFRTPVHHKLRRPAKEKRYGQLACKDDFCWETMTLESCQSNLWSLFRQSKAVEFTWDCFPCQSSNLCGRNYFACMMKVNK